MGAAFCFRPPRSTAAEADSHSNNGIKQEAAPTLWSRMEFHPQRNDRWTLSLSSNELGSRLPLKPSFGPGGLRTCNAFFQKTTRLL